MRIWRRLLKMGAVSLKGSVYVLPDSEDHVEALYWLTGEVASLGGEAAFVKVARIETMADEEIVALFEAQRQSDYSPLEAGLEALEVQLSSVEQRGDPQARDKLELAFQKIRKTCQGIRAIDFFRSPRGSGLQERLERFETRFAQLTKPLQGEKPKSATPRRKEDYRDRVWVTRKNPFVDRMASAWLIRRFIDPQARFAFLEEDGMPVRVSEAVSFDVPGGDFSHQQDRCTFEVLLETFGLRDKALRRVGEIVHEMDLKDGKYSHAQTSGVESILLGIRKTAQDDREALEEGIRVFERLYVALTR